MNHLKSLFIIMALLGLTLAFSPSAIAASVEDSPGDSVVENPDTDDGVVPVDTTGTVHQAVIPYSTTGGDWVSGLSIHNMGDETVYYQIGFYDSDGQWEDGKIFSIAAKGLKTDTINNFDDEQSLSGNYTIYIRTLNANQQFAATLFVANADSLKGFGFQSFVSQQVTLTLIDDPATVAIGAIDDNLYEPIPGFSSVLLNAF